MKAPYRISFADRDGEPRAYFASSIEFPDLANAVLCARASCEGAQRGAMSNHPVIGFLVTGPRGVEHSELI